LNSATGCGNEAFDGGRVQTACEFLLFGFDTRNDGNSKQVLEYAPVQIKDLANLGVGFRFGEECGVALLPEEFTGAKERLGVLKLPSYNTVPLVQLQRKIAMALDPFRVV
jgi:hypothetical protein